jgi:hypothetical protein
MGGLYLKLSRARAPFFAAVARGLLHAVGVVGPGGEVPASVARVVPFSGDADGGARRGVEGRLRCHRSAIVAGELLAVDARQRAQHVGFGRGEKRQLERERQDVLANGDLRDHAVDQVRRAPRHAPARAARTEAAIAA